jgi:hypothetical protein
MKGNLMFITGVIPGIVLGVVCIIGLTRFLVYLDNKEFKRQLLEDIIANQKNAFGDE